MPLPATALSTGFMKYYRMTMRPSLLFVSGITGLAGLSLAPPLPAPLTVVLFLVFFFSYGLSSLALALLRVREPATDRYFKRRWWGGPFYNGSIVAVLMLIGYDCGLGAAQLVISDPVYFALICVLFGYANVALAGNFINVTADAAAGCSTMVVAFGRDISAAVSDIFAIVFVITGTACVLSSLKPAAVSSPVLHLSAVAAFWAACMVSSVAAQVRLHKVERDGEAVTAIAPMMHAYILMLCAICAANKPEWTAALVLLYFGFAATLAISAESSHI